MNPRNFSGPSSPNISTLPTRNRGVIRQTLLGALALAMACGVSQPARANSEMFPPEAAAKKAIDFDGYGFFVNGKRTWIASGSIHYPRVPRELWRDRLLRLKRAGFDCVETYAFWNYHELEEGKFDFSGQKDFGAFLDAAHEVGLYAIVRVGPYVCAEWENGGYPLWLRFKPDVRVREDNPQFLAAMDRWYEHILPIVAARQIQKGGSVIMVQLENEHPWGWGTSAPTPYFSHMREKAQGLGIEVPTFFSGLHHGADPAPLTPESAAKRQTPWFSTEFWPGWYSMYGKLPETGGRSVRQFERGLWRILANGGNGYNFYMIHGGSNFDHWNNDEDAASYDYGAAIGQAGDLRPIYYRFKRATLFARSFESILEECDNTTNENQDAASGATVTARGGGAGTIVFLDNPTESAASAHLLDGTEIKLEAGETVGLVRDFFLTKTFKIESSATRILGFAREGATTTLVIHGQPGEAGKLTLNVTGKPVPDGSKGWSVDPPRPTNAGPVTLTVAFPAVGAEAGPEEHILTSGTEKLRVLVMNKSMTDRTWIVDEQGTQYVVYGPEYLGDFSVAGGKAKLTAEDSLARKDAYPTLVYGPAEPQRLTPSEQASADEPVAPKLENWQTFRADSEATPDFDVSKWKTSDQPLPMGVDNDTSAYAWYRATVDELEPVKQFLQIPFVGDQAVVFLNGKRVPTPASRGTLTLGLELKAGLNTVAILVSHNGRDKFCGTLGPIDKLDVKGIQGPITLSSLPRSVISLEQWKSKSVPKGAADSALSTDTSNAGWTEAKIDSGARNLHGCSASAVWYRAELPQIPGPARKLHLAFVYDKAAIYLNGGKMADVLGGGMPVDVKLDAGWKSGSPNILAIRVENVTGAGGVVGQPRIESQMPGSILKGWKMRGGLTDAFSASAKWQDGANAVGVPAYYRVKFTAPESGSVNEIVRFSPKGLTRGFVWLNGHNLGRYPEKISVDGFYLPECWLKAGENTLVVLDEEGASPKAAALVIETAASRKINKLGQ